MINSCTLTSAQDSFDSMKAPSIFTNKLSSQIYRRKKLVSIKVLCETSCLC